MRPLDRIAGVRRTRPVDDVPAVPEVRVLTAERFATLTRVIDLIAPGPFSSQEFLDNAMGVNAVVDRAHVEPVLAHLLEIGVIRQANGDQEPLWYKLSVPDSVPAEWARQLDVPEFS